MGSSSSAVACLLLLMLPCRLAGHGVELHKPSPAELSQTPPPLAGAGAFAEELLAHCGSGGSPRQAALLAQIARGFAAAREIRGGLHHHLDERDAAWFQSQGERALREWVEGEHDAPRFDLRPGRVPRKPDRVVELRPQFDHLLLGVVTGDGPPVFRVQTIDLVSERDPEQSTVIVAPDATSWVLLRLRQIPSGVSRCQLAFRPDRAPDPVGFGLIALQSPETGRLLLDVADELGKPVPVLLRLTAKASGRLEEPVGAVDLTAMLNEVTKLPIYGPGRGYTVHIPGQFRGVYWVVAKPVDMTLAAGEWELQALHGLEYEPVHETLLVRAGQTTRHTLRLCRWTDMPAQGWFSGDDHVHSRLMSGEDAERLMAFARAADIHVSNVLEMGNETRTWYAQRGFGPEFRVREGDHWLVPGQEDPRSMLGHAIGLNLLAKVRDPDRYCLNDWVAAEIHRQGGLYGHTHAGNSEVKTLFTEREMALFTPMGIVDFNSILQNKLGLDLYYTFLNLGLKMTASAGSDTPYGGTVGCVRLYARCGEGQFNPDRWFEALGRGRTFVTNGPMLDFRVDEAWPGDTIELGDERPLRVKIRATGRRGGSAPKTLRLVQFGRILKEVGAAGEDQTELELAATVPAGHGSWLAAHAIGRDGSEAHTTPVYAVRKGFRFWDVGQAAGLIEKQLGVLGEIETALAAAEEADRSGRHPLDYWNHLPANQSAQIRERVANARKFYHELQGTLRAELGQRGDQSPRVPGSGS